MKKVGAKPAQLVRSASRRGKSASRFQFDVSVEKLFGSIVRPGNTYYVKWSRGVKVAQTKPVLAAKEHTGGNKVSGGLPFGEKMSLLVTLYRTDNRFDEKDAKIAVISVNSKGQERTVAKMHFDLSTFAGVPSASMEKLFKLSEKASLKTTIDSRFMKSGNKGPGSAGASSAMSGMTAASGMSSDEDEEDDFGDLDVNDVPEPEPVRQNMPSVRSRRSSGASGATTGGKNAASPKVRASPSPAKSDSVPHAAFSAASSGASSAAPSSVNSFGRQKSGSSSGSREEIEKLRAELATMKDEYEKQGIDLRRSQDKRKRLEAAHEAELASLRAKLAAAPAGAGAGNPALEREVAKERRRADDMTGKVENLNREIATIRGERDTLRGEVEPLRMTAREVEKLRTANKELGRNVDELTASAGGGASGGDRIVKERLAKLQAEKEALETKVRQHQSHSAKVKETYQKLSGMYNTLRDENIELQGKVEDMDAQLKEAEEGRKGAERKAFEASTAASDAASRAAAAANRESTGSRRARDYDGDDQVEALESQLADSEREVEDIKASKKALQRDTEHLKSQIESMQDRLDKAVAEKEKARKEGDSLAAKVAEITVQRDAAVSRADRADGKRESSSGEDEAKVAAAIKAREEAERELVHMKQRISELEREISDQVEDLEYERLEKTKAREERDALRESARALERRTSQVSQTADAVHSLKRQLSTHKMREADQSAMITDLRDEVNRLQAEVDAKSASGGDDNAVLEDLVATKLALATAEDDKLQLQFQLKNQKKNERAIQEKLAAHASRLEVQLGEANDELAKARALQNQGEDDSLE